MNFFTKTDLSLEQILKIYFSSDQQWQLYAGKVDLLVKIVDTLRPKNVTAETEVSLEVLILFLEKYESYRNGFSAYLISVLRGKKFSSILSDAGIMNDTNFFAEMKTRLIAKVLPEQPELESLEYVLNQVFFKSTDPQWLQKLPMEQLEHLMELLHFHSIFGNARKNPVLTEILFALEVLTYRICGAAMEHDVIKMVPELAGFDSPFISFQSEMRQLKQRFFETDEPYIIPDDLGLKHLLLMHQQCVDFIAKAFSNSAQFGISLRVNQKLLRIRQQLSRTKTLLDILIRGAAEKEMTNTIQIAWLLIEINCQKNAVSSLFGESTQLISYEITQHTAKTGEHYITESRDEYFQMFRAAMGGGVIVGLLCLNKLKLSKLDLSDFGYALYYGLNYAIGFVIIYLLGFTLATKQPAMTAAALVKALKTGLASTDLPEMKYQKFAELFARLFRSQFIAFVGNVLTALPVAMLGIWLIDLIWQENIAEMKWEKLLKDLSPVHSKAIFHAAIAGFFLFLSGLIAGYIANRDRHHRYYFRIAEHPLIKLTFGHTTAKSLSAWYEKKWAGIVSNFWFGIFLGSTASLGSFFGLNLDIRHITFAAGNFSIAWFGSHFTAPWGMLLWGILGIGIIGLVNFLVSFLLSLGLAFRSRAIPISELRPVVWSIWHHFNAAPRQFFFPDKNH